MSTKKYFGKEEAFQEGQISKQEMMRILTETVSHPGFDSLVREIDAQPTEARKYEYAKAYASIEELQKRGVPLPQGFRICLRQFEDSDSNAHFDLIEIEGKALARTGSWTVCASLGYIFCVSVGYSTKTAAVRTPLNM